MSYENSDDGKDFVYSKDALHHLPGFWKVEALKNVGEALAVGDVFRLRDFVFSFYPRDCREEIQSWIDEQKVSKDFTEEKIHRHFREEYSTYGFLLESILGEVVFEILESNREDDLNTSYVCRWQRVPD